MLDHRQGEDVARRVLVLGEEGGVVGARGAGGVERFPPGVADDEQAWMAGLKAGQRIIRGRHRCGGEEQNEGEEERKAAHDGAMFARRAARFNERSLSRSRVKGGVVP